MRHRTQSAIFSEINITPLTDIFLVLLTIVIVVAPLFTQSRRDIRPPRLSSGSPIEQGALTIEIAKDGSYTVAGKSVREAELAEALKEEATRSSKAFVIRGDKTSESHAVLTLLEKAQEAGFEQAIIAGEAAPADALSSPTPEAADEKS